jgi:large subunit ribosomal protein L21
MHAVIRTGGKQYRVAPAEIIWVEKLEGEAGASIALNEVLMVSDGGEVALGAPLVEGASVSAEIVQQTRGDKVIIFKKRRRQNSRRKNGHRQSFTVLKITEISGLGKVARAQDAVAGAKAEKVTTEKPKRVRKAKAKPAAEATADEE